MRRRRAGISVRATFFLRTGFYSRAAVARRRTCAPTSTHVFGSDRIDVGSFHVRMRFSEKSTDVEVAGIHREIASLVARPLGLRTVTVELDTVLIGIAKVESFAH